METIIVLYVAVGVLCLWTVITVIYWLKKQKARKKETVPERNTIPADNPVAEGGTPFLRLSFSKLTTDGMAKEFAVGVECSAFNWEVEIPAAIRWIEVYKETSRRFLLRVTSNFGTEPREAVIEVTAVEPGGNKLQATLPIMQQQVGLPTNVEVSDSFFVFSGDTYNTVTPEIRVGDECRQWKVKSVYTSDGSGWCTVRPAVQIPVTGTNKLKITTAPKPHFIQNRNAVITVECGIYPFNVLKQITLTQGVIFSYYIEYPAYDICARHHGVIETPLAYKEGDPVKQYTVLVRCNLRWRIVKSDQPWIKVGEPEMVNGRFDGHFVITVLPNDESTRKGGYCAARHAIISLVTETGQVKDVLIYQGGYVKIKGKYWLDRNLCGTKQLTDCAIPLGVPVVHETYGCFFQFGSMEKGWKSAYSPQTDAWNRNTEEHPVKNPDTDPSPDGWRIPSRFELSELLESLNTPGNGLSNYQEDDRIPGACTCFSLLSDTGVPVFFPMDGYRSHITGSIMDKGTQGYYWSSAESSSIYAPALWLTRGKKAQVCRCLKKHAFSIRCILINE